LSGLAASIGFWIWTARLKHPSVKICPALSYYEQDGKCRSTVALINQGKRPAADISIIAELSLHGISKRTEQNFNMSLRVRDERLPYLMFAKEEQYFLRPSDIIWNYKDEFRNHLPSKLGELVNSKVTPDMTLREILEDAESEEVDARIKVYVIANDSVYGARSYPSQEFRSKDFLTGDFAPGRRCTLLGQSEPNPNCCQFPNSRWDYLLHRAYYREIRPGGPKHERSHSRLLPDLPAAPDCDSAPSNPIGANGFAVEDQSQGGAPGT
jgi:hypothetical protein